MPHDVFISYSTKDEQIANELRTTLESNRITCWIAPRDILPGEKYSGAIVKAINGAGLMVLVLSSHTNDSENVLSEVDQAYKKSVRIIQFCIDDVPLSESLDYYLSTSHRMRAWGLPKESSLHDLLSTVRSLLNKSPESTPPPGPAQRSDPLESARSTTPQSPESQSRPFFLKSRMNAGIIGISVILFIALSYVVLNKQPQKGNSNGNSNTSPVITKRGTVVVYHPSQINISALERPLKERGYSLTDQGPPDVAPDNTEVRYYSAEEKDDAVNVMSIIAETLNMKPNLRDRSGDKSAVKNHPKGTIVVYLK
jgi:TIR domain-containing protein